MSQSFSRMGIILFVLSYNFLVTYMLETKASSLVSFIAGLAWYFVFFAWFDSKWVHISRVKPVDKKEEPK